MQKKVGLNSDMRVYFDMDGTIAKWCDVPVEESQKAGILCRLWSRKRSLLDFMRACHETRGKYLHSVIILHGYQGFVRKEEMAGSSICRKLIPRTASLCRTERTRQSSSRQCCIGNFVLKIS